jgi:hypothetical protein
MKIFWSLGLLSLVVGFAGFAVGQAVKPGQEQFARGRDLVESNCVDCMGGARAGMEQGVRQIEDALKAGYPDKKAAFKLLLNAYSELSTFTEKDPPAHQAYAEKRAQILKGLVEISPQDPEVLKEYADSLQDPDKKEAALTKIIALNPNLSDARYELGLITTRKGKTAEGIQMVEDAIVHQGDPDGLRNYVQGMISLLDEVKCPLYNAEQWNTKLNGAYDKAIQGAGDPAALSNFTKSFLDAVRRQACAGTAKANR